MARADTDTQKAVVRFWLEELKQARKREKSFRSFGLEVLKIYEGDDENEVPFNILYSNTETLLPALYSAQPRPVVQRRFKDDDPLGKHVSDAGRRMLDYLTDTNAEGYETFHESMSAITLDALLPGRGVSVLKYDASFAPLEEPRPPHETDEEPAGPPTAEYVTSELVCIESMIWDRVFFGYAKKWTRVPWVAYEFYLTKEEVVTLLGGDRAARTMANKLKYRAAEPEDPEDPRRRSREEQDQGQQKTTCVYQIWDKAGGRKIRYLSPDYADALLKEEDDPLQLTGFFNCPRPLCFVEKSCSLVPTAPYRLYKNQARELNRLTKRINKIVEAIKARGIYDGSLGTDLEKLMETDDNGLVPAETASSLATEKGFENAIWFLPVEQLIAVLVQLYQARESCKQVIYEITGIADIMRGASKASETLGAQELKTQWGTLRIKRLQREVQRYARDVLRMMLELAASKFSEDSWAGMTNLPFLTTGQFQQIQLQLQAAQASGLPPTDPTMQALLAKAQTPVWGQILQVLRDDLQRSYRIDIETNSTVEPEAAEDQKSITDLLTALGMYLQGIGPLVMKGVMPFQAAQAMMLAIARRFRFGSEIEDYIKAMQPPQPEGHAEAQQQQAEQDLSFKQKHAELAIKEQAMQAEMEQKQREMDLHMRELQLQLEQQKMQLQQQAAQQALQMKTSMEQEKLAFKQKTAEQENRRYKTEHVVNQKSEQTMGKGLQGLQQIVQQLSQMLHAQSGEHQQTMAQLMKQLAAPRVRKAVRGKDGKLESVTEEVAA